MTRSHRYKPQLNRTDEEMVPSYRVAIIPSGARLPRDKGKVEVGCMIAERWILAQLRPRTFFSLAELHAEIRKLVALAQRVTL